MLEGAFLVTHQPCLLAPIHQLTKAAICPDLAQICSPEPAGLRKLREKHIAEIEQFAAANGLSVEVRDTGLNATFRKLKPA